jgi:peptide/nickel transport system permease protein
MRTPLSSELHREAKPTPLHVRAWRVRRTKIGAALVLPIVTLAFVGPLLAGSGTDFVGEPFAARTVVGPFGADVLGRDVWARFLAGGRSTLTVAVLAAVLGVVIGCIVGVGTALSRSKLGDAIASVMDVAIVFPIYVLALAVVSVFGSTSVAFVIAAAFVPIVSRVIRASALEVTKREHVHYARLLGASRWQVASREILPNITGPLSVEAGLRLTFAIAFVSAFSYLGFGARPPAPDWGTMISENQAGLQVQPWGVFLPVLTIALLTIGTNLIAEGFAVASAARGHHTSGGALETEAAVAAALPPRTSLSDTDEAKP